jgi:hypothetical protein
MPDRYRAPGGWTVEVITLSGTPDKRDGQWLRVALHGVHVADVRSVAELTQWFPLAELEDDALSLARPLSSPRGRSALRICRSWHCPECRNRRAAVVVVGLVSEPEPAPRRGESPLVLFRAATAGPAVRQPPGAILAR